MAELRIECDECGRMWICDDEDWDQSTKCDDCYEFELLEAIDDRESELIPYDEPDECE